MNLNVCINMTKGEVSVLLDGLGEQEDLSCETVFHWYRSGSEDNKCGFIVKSDSIGIFEFPDSFVTVSEVASELFLWMYVQILARQCGINDENISYEADDGISLKRVAFLPPSVNDDETVQEFPAMQNDLLRIWLSYQNEGRLKEDHIEAAQDAELLFDFLSLLNVERLFLLIRKDLKEN